MINIQKHSSVEEDLFGNATSLSDLGDALRSSLSVRDQSQDNEEEAEVVEKKSKGRRFSSVLKGLFTSSGKEKKEDVANAEESRNAALDEASAVRARKKERDAETEVQRMKNNAKEFACSREQSLPNVFQSFGPSFAVADSSRLEPSPDSPAPVPEPAPAFISASASAPVVVTFSVPAPPAATPETARRKSQSLFSKEAGYKRPKSMKALSTLYRVTGREPGKATGQEEEEHTPEAYDILLHLADFAYRLEVSAAETDMLETIFQYSSEEIYDVIASIRAAHEILDNNAFAGNKIVESHDRKLDEVKAAIKRNYAKAQVHVELPKQVLHEALFEPEEDEQDVSEYDQIARAAEAACAQPAVVDEQRTKPTSMDPVRAHANKRESMHQYPSIHGSIGNFESANAANANASTIGEGDENDEDDEDEDVSAYHPPSPPPSPPLPLRAAAGGSRRLSVVTLVPLSAEVLTTVKDEIIGNRIGVRYVDDNGVECWSQGIVVDYLPELERHEIIFEDGLRVDLDLSEETVRLEA